MKILDSDKSFATFASAYIKEKMAGLTPEQIEGRMTELYDAFGDAPNPDLDGLSPRAYYDSFTADELVEGLHAHLTADVDPSAYLCDALAKKAGGEDALVGLLSSDNEEELVYAMTLLSDKGSKKGLKRYVEFITFDYGESVKELATELLSEYADEVKEDVIAASSDASDAVLSYFLEILSRTKSGDERVFTLLMNAFLKNPDQIPYYASLLSRYGDERAIPALKTLAEDKDVGYVDYCELVNAVETLGGTVEKRDFSDDADYQAVVMERERLKTEGYKA